MSEVDSLRMKGLIAASFTPCKENGDINLDIIEDYAKYLKENGVSGVFVNGTTGESLSLTQQERKALAEKWIECAKSKLNHVVIHVGTENLRDSQELASHARSIGASAIAAMPPIFLKPTNLDTLVDYCKDVASSAPGIPFYYYHIPSMTGTTFNMLDFLMKAGPKIPTLRGLKFSSPDLAEGHLCHLFADRKFDILFGVDQQLLSARVIGIEGAVGSTYNFMPQIYNKMLKSFEQGDLEVSGQEQSKAALVVDTVFRLGTPGISTLKPMMKLVGLDLGPVRPPLINLTPEEVSTIDNKLRDIKFYDWLKN